MFPFFSIDGMGTHSERVMFNQTVGWLFVVLEVMGEKAINSYLKHSYYSENINFAILKTYLEFAIYPCLSIDWTVA